MWCQTYTRPQASAQLLGGLWFDPAGSHCLSPLAPSCFAGVYVIKPKPGHEMHHKSTRAHSLNVCPTHMFGAQRNRLHEVNHDSTSVKSMHKLSYHGCLASHVIASGTKSMERITYGISSMQWGGGISYICRLAQGRPRQELSDILLGCVLHTCYYNGFIPMGSRRIKRRCHVIPLRLVKLF